MTEDGRWRTEKKDDGRWTKGGWTTVGDRGLDVGKVRRLEKQKIGRSPVKSLLGDLPMAAFNGASGDRKAQDRAKNNFDIKIGNWDADFWNLVYPVK